MENDKLGSYEFKKFKPEYSEELEKVIKRLLSGFNEDKKKDEVFREIIKLSEMLGSGLFNNFSGNVNKLLRETKETISNKSLTRAVYIMSFIMFLDNFMDNIKNPEDKMIILGDFISYNGEWILNYLKK